MRILSPGRRGQTRRLYTRDLAETVVLFSTARLEIVAVARSRTHDVHDVCTSDATSSPGYLKHSS